jgi:hypothetical protein
LVDITWLAPCVRELKANSLKNCMAPAIYYIKLYNQGFTGETLYFFYS